MPARLDGATIAKLGDVVGGRYQFTIDSKVYPQFLADVGDCYALTKNCFDGSALNRSYLGLFKDLHAWQRFAFVLGVSLDHNSDDTVRDRLVSGLNTNGSNIPITWTMSNTVSATYRPIVFTEMTSTLLVYPGRVISVVN